MKHALLSVLLVASAVLGRGQTTAISLAPIVVTADRIPEPASSTGTSVDVVSGSDLAREQLSSLEDALSGVPSTPVFATGQAGASASLFLRGSNSNQTLFLVDGIRINDANTGYGPFLSGARVFPADTIEIDRGAQSTLYGGEAVGGVVSLRLAPGSGAPTGEAEVEAGSYGTIDGLLSAQGSDGAWGYDVAVSGEHTDNERINNAFDSASLALRLDDRISPVLSVGATLRGLVEDYGDPGDVYTNNPYDYEKEDDWLGTLFADAKLTETVSSHLTLGAQDQRYVTVTPDPGQPTGIEVARDTRGVVDWQVTAALTDYDTLTSGLTAETESAYDNGFGSVDQHQTLLGVFAQDDLTLVQNVHLTGGIRNDDYSTFGSATTGRATAAWLVGGGPLKLRASYGTSFDTPSFLDLYGQSPYYVGNPRVLPERSRGEDAGFDYYLPQAGAVVSASWYRNDYRNLIVDNFAVFPATTENVDQARTEGVELSVKATLIAAIRGRLAYTYLDARDLTTPGPLLRRPRNSASGDLDRDFGALTVGVGAAYVGRRADVDALTYDTIADPGYTVARVYAAYALSANLALKARVENALDRHYAPVNGYPEPGTEIYGGLDYKF